MLVRVEGGVASISLKRFASGVNSVSTNLSAAELETEDSVVLYTCTVYVSLNLNKEKMVKSYKSLLSTSGNQEDGSTS